MDVDSKCLRDAILEVRGQGIAPLPPQPVGDAVRLESVKALVIQEWLRVAACRGVSRSRRQEIGADRGADRHILGQGSLIRSRSRIAGRSGVCSLLARITPRASSSF